MKTKKIILMYCLFILTQTIIKANTIHTTKSGNWSDPEIWSNNNLPLPGDFVTINTSHQVIVDTQVQVNGITIKGILKPTPIKDIQIYTPYILIQGSSAAMIWGTETNPYNKKTRITLTGDKSSPPIPLNSPMPVYKGIMAMGEATLSLFGENKVSWTQLNANAYKSDKQIVVDGVVDWNIGDQFVIASTSYNMNKAEVRKVVDLQVSGNETTVYFNQPLNHWHFGKQQTYTSTDGTQTWTLDERAEVGLLSRNITIQGDAQSEITKFGGHIMVMGNSKAYVSNIELYRMGQRGILGRYPIHWHLNGNSDGQFIKNSSVHNTYNRAITIHGTNSINVSHNVCYDNLGHAYFLEDGSEIDNVFENNLGLVTRRPEEEHALLPSDILEHDIFSGPSTFWISNPDNIVRNNHAGGSKGSGFWLAPHSVLNTSNPQNSAVHPEAWFGNTAHSNKHGVLFGGQPNNGDPNQEPVTGTGLWTYRDVVLSDHTTYKNHTGSYIRNNRAKTYMKNWKMADNFRGVINTWETYFDNCLYVGGSENYEKRFGNCNNDNSQKIYGHTLYDGPSFIRNCHFAQFDKPNMSAIGNRGASRRTFVSELQNVSSDMEPAQINFPSNPFDDPHHLGAGIYDDEQGTISGMSKAAIVRGHPFMINDNCTQIRDGLNGYACPHRYGHFTLRTHYNNSYNNNKRQPITISRSDGESVNLKPVWTMNYYQFNTIIEEQYSYKILFSEHIPSQFTLEASSFNKGESAIIEIPNIGISQPHIKSFINNSSTVLTGKNSYTALKNATQTAYYFNENTLYIKVVMPINHIYNGGPLEYPHSIQVCLTNSCNNSSTKEITLCNNNQNWSITSSNNTCSNYSRTFNEQDLSYFKFLKVSLFDVANQFTSIKANIIDSNEGATALGYLPLNNNDKVFYFALPVGKRKNKDEVYQINLATCGGFSKNQIKSVELLTGSKIPPLITNLNPFISSNANISLYLNSLVDNWSTNMQIAVGNLPNGLNYNQNTTELSGILPGPAKHPVYIEVTNGSSGVSRQKVELEKAAIPNFSFEFPKQDDGSGNRVDNVTLYGTEIAAHQKLTGWLFSGESGISENNTSYTNQTVDAPNGNQVAVLKGKSEICAEIEIAENKNTLLFDAAQRNCNQQTIQVTINGETVEEFKPDNNGKYTTFQIDISTYANASATICFKGLHNWPTAFIDNVKFDNCYTNTCNDGDICTINDTFDEFCNCLGTFADDDGDGICNAKDICPNGDDNIDINNNEVPDVCDECILNANQVCNDNDPCTINDSYDNNCICTGTFADDDEDGICNANDVCPDGDDKIDVNNNNIPDACEGDCPKLSTFLNGGFEQPALDNNYSSYTFRPAFANWNFDSNTGVTGMNSVFNLHNEATPKGDQVAFIRQGNSICQTIEISQPGNYSLNLLGALRFNNSESVQTVDVMLDGNLIDSFNFNTTTFKRYETKQFSLSNTCSEFCIAVKYEHNSNVIVFLDDVKLNEATNTTCNQVFNKEDFELGFGIWNDGGGNANRFKYEPYAFSGEHFVRLKSNMESSTITTNNLNFENVSLVSINFNYFTLSMDNATEDFWLQVSTDGGNTFTTVEEWNLGDEFQNLERYNETVEFSHAFTNQTQFRFRCDASSHNDLVFLDDITINTCSIKTRIKNTNDQAELSNEIDLKFAPNPANSVAHVCYSLASSSPVYLNLYDISGKIIKTIENGIVKEKGKHNLQLRVDKLPFGTYLLVCQTEFGSAQQKVIISK